ncbi:hypothetical protein ACFO5O_01725 [Geojedonia litorea]|uniref:Uncharacterized protein n=1 Tax=Geojedonia litorea TaxID=1268269 RepID=A0ABV9N216_9FLAO
MRLIKYLFLFLIIISCNSGESEEDTIDYFEIIVQESPWILDRVEILEIEGENGYTFTQSEIEELAEIMKNNFYCTFDFYNNGTGQWNSEGYCPNCEIIWNLILEENKIEWANRSYIHSYYIRSINQTIEIIWNINYENGFGFWKPDGTRVNGNRLIGNYVWN